MIYVYVQAPFAAFRTFTAGWYRPTATFMTHSAAYGLLLNLAGIESRLREGENEHDGKTPASLMRNRGLPTCEIALGVPCADDADESEFPRLQSVYQQLHNYPVGATGKGRAEGCRGNKYNIAPVRREFLSGLKVVIALKSPTAPGSDLENQVRSGLSGHGQPQRYGLPFLGDNAFLPDRITCVETPSTIYWVQYEDDTPYRVWCKTVRWYEKLGPETRNARPRGARLTRHIDRADMSRTESDLYAPQAVPTIIAPPGAWAEIASPL